LREGILVDELSRAGEWLQGDPDDVRWRSTRALGRRFAVDEAHAQRVTTLALGLFDGLVEVGRPDARWREYLRCATYLHEAGRFLSYTGYHRHSYYLIRNAAMPGFAVQEQEIVALIARYHRKRAPKPGDDEFDGLGDDEVRHIQFTAALLRLAVALDKSRRGVVSRVSCLATETKIHVAVTTRARGEPQSEMYHFENERPVLESCLRREVILQVMPSP
jgi:exopolyphosphatase/guanosine-5'-triphosphate,3'-diphosphate pyrophosphatase